MNSRLLNDALLNHPRRDKLEWGCRITHLFDAPVRGTDRAYYYVTSANGGYTCGRVPLGLPLRVAVDAYFNSLRVWVNVEMYRLSELGFTTVQMMGLDAFNGDGYDAKKFVSPIEELRKKGAILPWVLTKQEQTKQHEQLALS